MATYQQTKEQIDELYAQAQRGLHRCNNVSAAFRDADVTMMTVWKVRKGHRCNLQNLFHILDKLHEAGVDTSESGDD